MSKLRSELQNAPSNTEVSLDLDALTDLVESQLGNVVGGGYSQFAGFHLKDVASDQPTAA